jgi:mannose-6-phosphate isomerase
MGAHPGGPSTLKFQGGEISLGDLIQRDPARWLGGEAGRAFGTLPFLFKVLAAEKPLSIQAHPNLEQARQGWERENREGVALDDPRRNYKDANHKPEILCALSPFTAMCGFREPETILRFLETFWGEAGTFLREACVPLGNALAPGGGPARTALRDFFSALFGLSPEARKALTDHALEAGPRLKRQVPQYAAEWELAARFAEYYPEDPGIIAPFYLNLLALEPGEAIYLPAGALHAYVRGLGVELMANSDNVLRGGLTPKHIDTTELTRILRFVPFRPEILKPGGDCFTYPGECREFALSAIRGRGGEVPFPVPGPAIAVVSSGRAVFKKDGEELVLNRGASAFIPAGAGPSIGGSYTLYAAGLPTGRRPG